MEKNTFLSAVIFCSILFVNQFTNAQTCSGDEVFMSKGCACGVKSNRCESKCVKPNQVNSLLKQGWYFGSCSYDCCPPIRIQEEGQSDGAVANDWSELPVVHEELNGDYHCDCLLADFGCKKNQKCYRYCFRSCFPMLSNTGDAIATNSSSFFISAKKALSVDVVHPSFFNSSWGWKVVNTQNRSDFINTAGTQLKIDEGSAELRLR